MTSIIYTVGGTVQASGGIYIERAADAELLELCRTGEFAYILHARQMGKSSIVAHTAEQLADQGIRPVVIDLTLIGTQVNADQWYFGLLETIVDQLELKFDILAWWREREHLGVTQRLAAFIQDLLLHEVPEQIVIFVDEIDTTLSLDFTDDFYAAIRALYNARAQQPDLRRIGVVLIGVATPGDLIKDPQRTPFNIGRQVTLTDFSPDEAQRFADGLHLPDAQADTALDRVLYWTRGHPYLTQLLCAAVAARSEASWDAAAVDALVQETLLGERSRQDNNLQFVRDMLTRRAPDPAAVLMTYRDIRRGKTVPDEERSLVKSHLRLSGAVRKQDGLLHVRNRIYAEAFDDRWVRESMPRDYWTRRALRVAIAALAGVAVVAVLLGAAWFGSNSRVSEIETERNNAVAAGQTAQTSEQNAQASQMRLQTAVTDLERANREAERRSRSAEAESLALRGVRAADTVGDPELGLLLALEAAQQVINNVADDTNHQIEQSLAQAVDQSAVRVQFKGHTAGVYSAVFSPDGKQVLTASVDTTARLWDVASGQVLHTLDGHTDTLSSAVFSPDGKQVLTASWDATARLWDVASGQVLHTLERHRNIVSSAVFSPDGKQVLTASWDATARLWDTASGHLLHTLAGHTETVSSAVFSSDGKQVLTASWDATARLWDATNGQLLHTLAGHSDRVNSAVFSPDGKQVLTASSDTTARLWDTASGQLLHTLTGHSDRVNSAVFSPDGKQVLTASWDATARLWDATNGQLLHTLTGHSGHVIRAVFSPDGWQMLTASSDTTARLWDATNGQLLHILVGHTDTLSSAVFSPDGRQVLTASDDHSAGRLELTALHDGTARLWDATNGQMLHTLEGHTDRVSRAVFSPDGRQVLTVSDDHTARLWDAANGQLLHTLEGHSNVVSSAVFSPDGKQILTASSDTTARLWDTASDQLLHTLEGHSGNVISAVFSPDGRQVLTASDDHTARLWDTANGQMLHTLAGHSNTISSAVFSPDGRQVITASWDKTARLWDTASGQLLHTLEGHSNVVSSAVFSPDGKQVLTASWDATARLWDTASGQPLHTLVGHSDALYRAVFSPDGKQALTASDDGTAQLWPVSLSDLVDLARSHLSKTNGVTRTLTADERKQYGVDALEGTP